MGLKLLKFSVLRLDLFSNGCTTADLRAEGMIPDDEDLLKTAEICDDKKTERSSKTSCG